MSEVLSKSFSLYPADERQAVRLGLAHVTRFVARFHVADDRHHAARAKLPRHPAEQAYPRRWFMRRHGAAPRLNQPRPTLRVPLFVLRELFKNHRALIVLFSRSHGAI